jgi:hypothetical protein
MSDSTIDGKKKSFKEKFIEEFIEYWINVAYLSFYFGVFIAYKRLVLAQYEVDFEEYGSAIISALILGKVVSIIGLTKIGRKTSEGNLALLTLYKTVAFSLLMVVFNALEKFISGYYHTSTFQGAIDHLITELTNYEYFARLLMIFTSFIPYFAIKELSRVVGHKKVINLFFKGKQESK